MKKDAKKYFCPLCEAAKSKKSPYGPRTVNGFTVGYERRMIKETEEALKSGKSYHSAKEMLEDIMKGIREV